MRTQAPQPPRIRISRPKADIHIGRFKLALSERTYIMGVLNVTPDSFSDGGAFFDKDRAIERGVEMACQGADIIDIGGESTRPGSGSVSAAEELNRVMPVVEKLYKKIDIPISIDTRKSEVAEAAVKAGASIINDISGLRHDGRIASVASRYGAVLIVMHMKGTPRDMQSMARYGNLIKDIIASLKGSIDIAKRSGVAEDKIIIDPGIGFGKTTKHNLEILNALDEFKALGRPICIGTSRKSFIGKVLDRPDTARRLTGTLATCAIAVMKGANILRVHDVREALETARMADSILKCEAA